MICFAFQVLLNFVDIFLESVSKIFSFFSIKNLGKKKISLMATFWCINFFHPLYLFLLSVMKKTMTKPMLKIVWSRWRKGLKSHSSLLPERGKDVLISCSLMNVILYCSPRIVCTLLKSSSIAWVKNYVFSGWEIWLHLIYLPLYPPYSPQN